jgi:hypothetical protein
MEARLALMSDDINILEVLKLKFLLSSQNLVDCVKAKV